MWIICSITSICLYFFAWIMLVKKNVLAYYASAGSMVFVSLTLLMEYRTVLKWINKEDWSALLDVVPSTFVMLAVYVIVMSVANAILISVMTKEKMVGFQSSSEKERK